MGPLSVEQLLDLREIEQLKYDYCWAYDEGDIDALVDLFVDDAVCVLDTFGTFSGLEAIRGGYAQIMGATGIPGSRRHLPGNPSISLDGDSAKGRWYLVDFRTESEARQPVRIFATYLDDYVKTPRGWKFAKVDMVIEWIERD